MDGCDCKIGLCDDGFCLEGTVISRDSLTERVLPSEPQHVHPGAWRLRAACVLHLLIYFKAWYGTISSSDDKDQVLLVGACSCRSTVGVITQISTTSYNPAVKIVLSGMKPWTREYEHIIGLEFGGK